MSYYGIDDIETDGLKVPCRFQVDAPGLGFLLSQKNTTVDEIPAGSKVMLPLWLAVPLASAAVGDDGSAFLAMEEPAALQQDVLNVLKSDPLALDLRGQNRLFTNLAVQWIEMFESQELANVLFETVKARAAGIFDSALAQHGADPGLDEYELALYQAALRAVRDARQWHRQAR